MATGLRCSPISPTSGAARGARAGFDRGSVPRRPPAVRSLRARRLGGRAPGPGPRRVARDRAGDRSAAHASRRSRRVRATKDATQPVPGRRSGSAPSRRSRSICADPHRRSSARGCRRARLDRTSSGASRPRAKPRPPVVRVDTSTKALRSRWCLSPDGFASPTTDAPARHQSARRWERSLPAKSRRPGPGFQRRGWDSNPRSPYGLNGFQGRHLRPLGHPAGGNLL